MIAQVDPGAMRDWMLAVGAGVLVVGYLVGQWRSGGAKGASEALTLRAQEVQVLKDANDRLSSDLHAAREEMAQLRGVVDQLREENKELRALVMGEKVPPALYEAMRTVATEAATSTAESLRRIERDLQRLVVQSPPGS